MSDDDKKDDTHVKLMQELQSSTVYQKAIEAVDPETRTKIERRVATFFAEFSRDLLVPLAARVGSEAFKSALVDHLNKRPQVGRDDVDVDGSKKSGN